MRRPTRPLFPGEIRVHGRIRFFRHVQSVTRTGPGRYTVAAGARGTFQIEGGRHAGGGRRDWFVDSRHWDGSIRCTSLMDALRLIDTM
jgi:hypothetical protein